MTKLDMQLEQLEQIVRDALDELKAVEPIMLDVRGRTSMTDIMFIATGNTSRHVKSIADNVVVKAKEAGLRPLGIEGEEAGEWVLVDLGDIVVHIMQAEVRKLYRLEGIWGLDTEGSNDDKLAPLLKKTH